MYCLLFHAVHPSNKIITLLPISPADMEFARTLIDVELNCPHIPLEAPKRRPVLRHFVAQKTKKVLFYHKVESWIAGESLSKKIITNISACTRSDRTAF